MSRYVRYYNNRKIFYRTFAESWISWAKSADLDIREIEGMTKFFRSIAKRFGLVQEFKEIGVIN
jgi:hypothetical protein